MAAQASVNVDAELVRRGGMLQQEEKMIELSNGCICCTLREDLLTSLSALAAENRFDHVRRRLRPQHDASLADGACTCSPIATAARRRPARAQVLVESSGISEPLPVAETFTFRDQGTGVALNDVARLHNLVTVVDAASVFEQLGTMDSLVDRGWNDVKGDTRTVAHLLCDQLEFADMLLVNKRDLVTEAQLGAVEAFLHKVNPAAEVVRTERSVLDPAKLLGTARFSLRKAAAHPQWLKEAREHEHTPETIEYGISSFIYRAKRPFHPGRLHAALGVRPRPGALAGLLRLKGFAWLASWARQQAHVALAGTQFTVAPGPAWWHAVPRAQWPAGLAEEIDEDWHAEHGDRRTELVCIGRALDHVAARAQLEACLLTEDEMARGEPSWRALADPFATPHGGEHDGEHGVLNGVTEANLREIMAQVSPHAYDELLGFMFESLLDEHAVAQLRACAPALRDVFAATASRRRTQQVVLAGVAKLGARLGAPMLQQTPAILYTLYDIGLLEKPFLVEWHAQAGLAEATAPEVEAGKKGKKASAKKKKKAGAEAEAGAEAGAFGQKGCADKEVREAATPLIEWLRAGEAAEEHALAASWGALSLGPAAPSQAAACAPVTAASPAATETAAEAADGSASIDESLPQGGACAPLAAGADGGAPAAPTSPWVAGYSAEGYLYYYNAETGESVWAANQREAESEATSPWVMGYNAEGFPYYFNHVTGESVWQLPEGAPPAQLPPGISVAGRG